MKWFRYVGIALLFIVAAPALAMTDPMAGFALAQSAVTDPSNLIDLLPTIERMFDYLTVIVVALVGWAAKRYGSRLGLDIDEKRAAVIDAVAHRAVGYMRTKAMEIAGRHAKVKIDHELMNLGVRYVIDSAPDAVAYFKITPERVREMIESRLSEYGGIDFAKAVRPASKND